jgi:hypothetical protein
LPSSERAHAGTVAIERRARAGIRCHRAPRPRGHPLPSSAAPDVPPAASREATRAQGAGDPMVSGGGG